MLRRTNSMIVILSAVMFLSGPCSLWAQVDSFTVNVPDVQGGYTPVVIQRSGAGYVGPQGEYYPAFPSVSSLEAMYGGGNAVAVNAISIAPPALPVYVQPDPPGPDYIWVPGYWAYDSFFEDYYWVPGTWILPPASGLLWTPGYWYWGGGHFIFSSGYWGPHVGFYGGINYGYGYGGRGFSGGSWSGGAFVNRPGSSMSVSIGAAVSFNGGPGGTRAQPTPTERAAMKEHHFPVTAQQKAHVQAARNNPALRASFNHGKPAIAASARPGVFKGAGIVAATRAGTFYNKTHPVTHPKPAPKPKPKPKTPPPQKKPQDQ